MARDWDNAGAPLLYNGHVETGMRSLVILDACSPHAFTLDELRLLEHFVVFGEDIGAPTGNLHVPLPNRANAHSFRGPMVQKGLDLLIGLGRTIRSTGIDGDVFSVPEDSVHLLDYVTVDYLLKMHGIALWMGGRIEQEGKQAFFTSLARRVAELSVASSGPPENPQEMYRQLDATYEADLMRMEGLLDAAWAMSVFRSMHMEDLAVAELPSAPDGKWFDTVSAKARAEMRAILSNRAGLAPLLG